MEPRKYEYIDVMRGLAILMVVAVHTGIATQLASPVLFHLSRFSQLGVQLFFVASALNLSLSMGARGATMREISKFYIRRYFRIAPLYYFGVVFYFSRILLLISSGSLKDVGPYEPFNILTNVLLVHGLYPPATNSIVPGGWSIGCEVLFYAIFPFVFRAVRGRRHALWFIAVSFALDLGALMILNSFGMLHYPVKNHSFYYFSLLNQLPVFGFGILLYYSALEVRKIPPWFNAAWSLGLLILTFCIWHATFLAEISALLLPIVAGAAFYNLGRCFAGLSLTDSLSRGLAHLGRKSFPIYVFHFVFCWHLSHSLMEFFVRHGVTSEYVAFPLVVLCIVSLSYGLALVTMRLIEEPGNRMGRAIIAKHLP